MSAQKNDLTKAMQGAMKSMGLPQAKNKINNAVSKFKQTKPKAPVGTFSPALTAGLMINGTSQ